ncbi:hypothetical protein EVAR_59754_1 [Eumeta japonica]|uniref:Uncharacterized protein n=1 Tax=Eumeta variegata TaxID=151549 RepID=A0A4C1ZPC8_EUMVA|nr:hypothetical protein EVAR_59754_1 [Eumeta japonica]
MPLPVLRNSNESDARGRPQPYARAPVRHKLSEISIVSALYTGRLRNDSIESIMNSLSGHIHMMPHCDSCLELQPTALVHCKLEVVSDDPHQMVIISETDEITCSPCYRTDGIIGLELNEYLSVDLSVKRTRFLHLIAGRLSAARRSQRRQC